MDQEPGRAPTRLVTLNRLVGVTGVEEAEQAIAVDDTDGDLVVGTEPMRVTVDRIAVGGRPALWFTFQTEAAPAAWAQDAEITLGRPVDIREQHSGGVLVIDVDERVYAISFGQGFRRILDGYRDQRFGLRVAVRCLDAQELSEIVGPDTVLWQRPGDLGEIVRRIGERTLPVGLTHQPAGDRAAKLLGTSGLRLRLGLRGEALVTDIRAIAALHDRPLPLADLALLDDVAPVSDARTRRQLDADLEDILSDPGELTGRAGNLAVSVPERALDRLDEVLSYRIAVGGRVSAVPELTLADIATALTGTAPGGRVPALTRGQIAPCELPGGRRQLTRPAALAWIEATVVAGDRHFALLDGEWHEFDRDFALRVGREVEEVFAGSAAAPLPAWPAGWSHAAYLGLVQETDPRYRRLDRRGVHEPGPELYDLLGPENELIHVQRARGSSTLSHLFARGLTSGLSLTSGLNVTDGLSSTDGPAPDDAPRRVVFAVAPEPGQELTAASLFPFARAALARTAAELRRHGVRVDVMGISTVAAAAVA